jgi:trimeric autotransporter adhesin
MSTGHVFMGRAFRVMALVMLVAAGSCADGTVEPDVVASIQLTPPTSTVRAGGTVTLAARPLDANGALVSVRSITWSSSNTAFATVSSAGVVTTLAPGDVRIAASAFGKSATATVSVTAREVASVVVTPPTLSVRVGGTIPLQAQTLDAEGGVLPGRPVTWSSSNTAVATVSSQGVVTGVATGAATITATSAGRTGQAAVTVTLPPVQTIVVSPARDTIGVGTERAFSAVLRDASGTPLTGRALAWSSSNVSVASVSSTGVVIGLAPGATTISATSEGRVGTAIVVVLERLASVVILTPGSGTLVVGTTQSLTAQVTDAQGNLLTNRPITYSSDAPSVASVSSTGVVTALTPGSVRITATSEGKIGTATFQVIPVPVAVVQISPTAPVLLPGATTQLTAVARSAAGTVLTGRQVTWLSGAPSVVTVSAGGLVTAVGPGTALVLATIDGVSASITVSVNLPTIASINLTPLAPEVTVLGSVQLVATPLSAAGTPITGRTVTWSSADESIAFVSSSGLVVGFRLGTVRITATSEGVSASTIVTVR